LQHVDGHRTILLAASGRRDELRATLSSTLRAILALTVPSAFQEGGTYVIPGYGRVADEADVVEYRDMLVIVRDRIQDLVAKGRTLDQVKASRPTRDYDNEYGVATGPWTTEMFVEAVYRSLTEKRQVKP